MGQVVSKMVHGMCLPIEEMTPWTGLVYVTSGFKLDQGQIPKPGV